MKKTQKVGIVITIASLVGMGILFAIDSSQNIVLCLPVLLLGIYTLFHKEGKDDTPVFKGVISQLLVASATTIATVLLIFYIGGLLNEKIILYTALGMLIVSVCVSWYLVFTKNGKRKSDD